MNTPRPSHGALKALVIQYRALGLRLSRGPSAHILLYGHQPTSLR